ncbi:MAG: cysteine--tRNA ligase [Candidatus Moranbacteria bacterium]|nr:cysteine--tRNA ligase [Candidatus Moranbacteria bacterium]
MRFYNTLTRSKEEFEPLHPGKVGMYTCGPTVYDYAHIGNLRAFVFSDTVRRLLEHDGYEVRLIENVTDVGHLTEDDLAQGDSGEDKVEKKARAEKKTPEEIARFYEDAFHADSDAMNILPAHFYPRATAHIGHMIRMIETLVARGHAYEVNGNVFYDVTSFPDYGKLSGNTLEQLRIGARLEEHPDKRNPWDFALWLRAPKEHLMKWPSPWSEGYPGWHIECSAMSQEYLGDTLDIHTGGEDHIFPHHEAEIAQSEGATGKPFSRFFLHERHILVDGQKMSKSKGNFYVLQDVTERGYSPMDLRLLYLSAHYRSQMNFTWDSLSQARKNRETLTTLRDRLAAAPAVSGEDIAADDREAFLASMRDDLNTPLALASLLSFAKKTNVALDANRTFDIDAARNFLDEALRLFGLRLESAALSVPDSDEIRDLIARREEARRNRDFALADSLRDELAARGVSVRDSVLAKDLPQGR